MDTKQLQAIYRELDSAYAPQRKLIQQQIKTLPGQFEPQKQALHQAKINAFRDITEGANEKGMFFSGFKPAEEARYTGTQYLPALANVDIAQTQQKTSLLETLNNLFKEQKTGSVDIYEGRRTLSEQMKEAERQRRFTAQQNQLDRRQQAALAAQRSASSSASSAGSNIQALTKLYNKGLGTIRSIASNKDYESDYHRWEAAANAIRKMGVDPFEFDKELTMQFGTTADKKAKGLL